MQRLRDERGAVSVVVALLMVPLIGFAAIAIDVSAIYAERQQLQTGADAGALAIAQDCARGGCGTPSQTAQTLATSNINDGTATATVTELTSSQVTVKNSAVRQHWFAPVLGISSSTISTKATVGWGSPIGGTAVLPLTFSVCEYLRQTNGGLPSGTQPIELLLTKQLKVSLDPPYPCTPKSGNVVPGGFGWLKTDLGTCQATSFIDDKPQSDPGKSVSNGCTTADFAAFQGKTVLLPIFDEAFDEGDTASYHVYGYAAFTITGYEFTGKYSSSPKPSCTNCIRGYFVKLVDLSDAFTYGVGAPQLGAAVVTLTE